MPRRVFVGYAHDDEARVADLLAALGGFHDVFSDRQLAAGDDFELRLEREIRSADCVVVCWSRSARERPWVRNEAALARDLGRIVSVTLDGSLPSLAFQHLHTTDLSSWNGDPGDVVFGRVLEGIEAVCSGHGPSPPVVSASAPAAGTLGLRLLIALLGLVALFWGGPALYRATTSPRPEPRASGGALPALGGRLREEVSPAPPQASDSSDPAEATSGGIASEEDPREAIPSREPDVRSLKPARPIEWTRLDSGNIVANGLEWWSGTFHGTWTESTGAITRANQASPPREGAAWRLPRLDELEDYARLVAAEAFPDPPSDLVWSGEGNGVLAYAVAVRDGQALRETVRKGSAHVFRLVRAME